jgi:hypothetical protein
MKRMLFVGALMAVVGCRGDARPVCIETDGEFREAVGNTWTVRRESDPNKRLWAMVATQNAGEFRTNAVVYFEEYAMIHDAACPAPEPSP